jgi:uncharacterized membrane protein HdeD (DUF308 family)
VADVAVSRLGDAGPRDHRELSPGGIAQRGRGSAWRPHAHLRNLHLSRIFDADEPHRIWLGIAGLLFIVAGVVLIRHLHLTRAIIGLFVGTVWIVQGVVSLVAGVSGGSRQGRAWWIAFGLLSIIAGIVVVAIPTSSLTFLAALLGIWFAVMGLLQIVGALMLRH